MTAEVIRRWRTPLAAAAAVAATTALLALPTPGSGTPGPPDQADTLAGIWPQARTVDAAATLPDGTTYTPAAVLDPHHIVVQIADADPDTASLALLDPADPAHPLRLDTIPIAGGGSFDAVTVDGGHVYWMSSVADDQNRTRDTLHRADAAGHTTVLTSDTGDATFRGSSYDLQAADGRIWWTATRGSTVPTTDLRSVPAGGGTVDVRPVDGTYHLTHWPWAVDDGTGGRPVIQRNLVTGAQRTLDQPIGQDLDCGAVWCRHVVRTTQGTVVTLGRTDGTAQTARINTDGEVPLFTDVAIVDRFEFFTAPISTQAATASERLTLYDLTNARRVGLAVSTAEGLSGTWLWWATGDNETMTWHLLDLATLQ
ncbi:hypothetical protein ACQP00_21375 [Dactylosporangium sp. CS-047395]|uniref:hypothetical protein n=1 Tax=Dactylosporangium sp. CS-047395 TaxID=3239936 RepID=UPI003D8AC6CE